MFFKDPLCFLSYLPRFVFDFCWKTFSVKPPNILGGKSILCGENIRQPFTERKLNKAHPGNFPAQQAVKKVYSIYSLRKVLFTSGAKSHPTRESIQDWLWVLHQLLQKSDHSSKTFHSLSTPHHKQKLPPDDDSTCTRRRTKSGHVKET